MADNTRTLRDSSDNPLNINDNPPPTKQKNDPAPANRVHIIITPKAGSSWVNDLDSMERLNLVRQVFH